MANIHGLSSSRSEKKADQEEFSQSSAGQSGTAVWRPTNSAARGGGGPAPDDPVAGLLARARQNAGGPANAAHDRNIGMLTVYANGFIIGNGEFRDTKDPKHQKMLADLKNGEVPQELEETCRKEWGNPEEVSVTLVDKSAETYTPPKPKFDFAKSQGQALGAAASSASAAAAAASFAEAVPRRLEVDSAQPTTTLQLVMGGKKVREVANQTTTLLQLYGHFMSVSGLAGFELVAGFPPKTITDPTLTLKEAGLLNGSITMRGGA